MAGRRSVRWRAERCTARPKKHGSDAMSQNVRSGSPRAGPSLCYKSLQHRVSMLLDPCDMENQYLSRWRAAGGTPLFPRVQHKHHTPVSSVKRAHSSRQLWGPDAVTGAGMRRRSRRRRSRAQLTSEIEEWRRVSWGQLSAPRSRQRAQDFKRARRGSFPDLAEQLSRLRFQ